jgi:2-dehydro-3-deoxygluconokinase
VTRGGPLVTLGETMGLFRPDGVGPGELVSSYHLASGGAESNVAIGVTRLGGSAHWIGRVGDDAIGRKVLRDLRGEGVAVSAIVDTEAGTGVMTKESRIPGRTAVHYARTGSAGSRLTASDIDPALIRSAGVLHVTGITPALSDSAQEALFRAVALARAAGVPVSLDVNHRPSLWRGRNPGPVYERLVAAADIVFAGEDEAAIVVGDGPAAEQAHRVALLGPTTVVIKRGHAGAVARHGDELVDLPAVPIIPVDTVGAGDAFVAGYLVEHLAGVDTLTALTTAVRCGAFACLAPGDWESLPRLAEMGLLDAREPVAR